MKREYLFAAALIGFVVAPQSGWALGVTVSPTRVLVEAPAGGTATFEVKFSNDSAAPLSVRAFAWDYWHGPEGRFAAPPGTTPRSAAGWIDVIPQVTVVPAGEGVTLIGSVSVPPQAQGGHYAMLYVQASDPEVPAIGAVAETGTRIGIAIAVAVTGTGTRSIQVDHSDFRAPSGTSPAVIGVACRNTGDTHFPVEFKGVVRSTDGETLGKVTSGGPRYYFPGESFVLEAQWTSTMEPGAYELAGTVLFADDGIVPLVTPLVVPVPTTSGVASPR